MISIFQKKIYLVDYLSGLVDIHNHILPGIDDGAKTIGDSLELIKGFSDFGVTNFICTPHIMHNYYDNTPSSIKKAYGQLSSELQKNDGWQVNLEYAAEHMIDDNFENILEANKVMPLSKDYLLIEMSYLQPSFNFDIAVDQIAKHKYFPILAHPERYMYYHGKYGKYASLRSEGVLFQLNLLSLAPKSYGKAVHKTTERLLNDGMIDFVGSDVHNIRQLKLLKETKISKKTLDHLFPIIENTIQTFY
ncbi:histidinol phosphatase [Muricauda sp. HICW]|uniref:protein-tyrosine-phosphatase n=1 Tax=Flagellimonas chongwuensis TaxID=2697365 RepID=A0A850NGQ5_9FLAO|nr:CpsB/CapC family capsule biosynthesis tyrosine phosphatase [Allomuricauda chongwuensis]NVN19304.1 histidinol phosphatase [Allomuricauda chongwuensis]